MNNFELKSEDLIKVLKSEKLKEYRDKYVNAYANLIMLNLFKTK